MILCLDLAWGMRVEDGLPSGYEGEIEAMWQRNKRLQALKSSYDIWCKSSTISALAAKAAEALRVMLKDLESAGSAEAVPTTLVSNPTSVSGMPLLFCISTPHDADPPPPPMQRPPRKYLYAVMKHTLGLPISSILTTSIL